VNPLTLIYIAVIFVAFYFLLIRPQQKRAKEQAALMASLATGDRVVTAGGLFGTIERLDSEIVDLRISDGVVVEVARSAIASRVDSTGHLVEEEPSDDEDAVPELPAKPRSEDVVEPEVHVGKPADKDDAAAEDAAADDASAEAEKGK
jgi:preprotein translocase subunit YajC